MNKNSVVTQEYCPNCGKINNIPLNSRSDLAYFCGICGTTLAANANRSTLKADEPVEFGFIQGIAVITVIFFLLRITFIFLPTNNLKLISIAAVLFLLTIFAPLRKALFVTLNAFLIIACAAFTITHFDKIINGKINFKEVANGIVQTYIGLNPIRALRNSFESNSYDRYIEKIDPLSIDINNLASRIVANCPAGDHYCEADAIALYVSGEIRYTSDPVTKSDYIKSPQQTLEARSGDCEDVTILTISLLESVGIKTLMAFEKYHTYPLACFEKSGSLASHQHIKVGSDYCFPLEPTAQNSSFGIKKDHLKVKAYFDVRSKKRILDKT